MDRMVRPSLTGLYGAITDHEYTWYKGVHVRRLPFISVEAYDTSKYCSFDTKWNQLYLVTWLHASIIYQVD